MGTTIQFGETRIGETEFGKPGFGELASNPISGLARSDIGCQNVQNPPFRSWERKSNRNRFQIDVGRFLLPRIDTRYRSTNDLHYVNLGFQLILLNFHNYRKEVYG